MLVMLAGRNESGLNTPKLKHIFGLVVKVRKQSDGIFDGILDLIENYR